MSITPRQTIPNILKKIEVRFPTIDNPKDRPPYILHINGVVEELRERIALAERDISLPAPYKHNSRSFILGEINARIIFNKKETIELYKEEYCQKRGEELFSWMLNNLPHGIFKVLADLIYKHWEIIKREEINYGTECNDR